MINDYVLPKTVEEALAALEQGNARIIAGGTDLLLDLQEGKKTPEILVDVTGIDSIQFIRESQGLICIGAGVTHQQITESSLLREKAAVLAKASGTVGSLQIRNTATLAGNVVNAQPAADGAVALVALGAEAVVQDQEGSRTELVENLYAGLNSSKVNSTYQMLTELRVPSLEITQGSAYVRWAKREALALPMLCVGVVVSMKGDRIEWARIAMAPVATQPQRALEAEAVLKGQVPTEEVIMQAAEAAVKAANPRDSKIRGSKVCRTSVLKNLVKRAILEALENVGK